MARPKKQTVDYFPHYCNGSRSLFIVQTQHGNDGYAFWFKLLQLLGKSEGHYYDYNDNDNWLFLLSETHVPEQKAKDILETLATIGSIDYDLWQQKILWSQNFVSNLEVVYKRRTVNMPSQPGTPPALEPIEDATEGEPKVKTMVEYFGEHIGRMLTPTELIKLNEFATEYPDGWFEKAVNEVENSPEPIKAPIPYIAKVLDTWKAQGGTESGVKKNRQRGAKLPKAGSYTNPDSV